MVIRQAHQWCLRYIKSLFYTPELVVGYESACKSIKGAREQNQDRCYSNDVRKLYLVADGLGGYKGGALASQIAIETIPDVMQDAINPSLLSDDQHLQTLQAAIDSACFEMSKIAREHEGYSRMGCTLAAAFVVGDSLYYANVGDCRVYLLRNDRLIQLTRDETMVQNLVAAKILTESQAKTHRLRHIVTNSVSAQGLQHAFGLDKTRLDPDDTVLLTSDGLINELSDDEISEVLRESDHSQSCVDKLIDLAIQRNASDNVSCVVFRPTSKPISSVENVVTRDDAAQPVQV